MHFPQGITGWTIFCTGLLVVMYRIHGIDAPRQWVEWIERQFTYSTNLRFFGGILLVAISAALYLGGTPPGIHGMLFGLSVALLMLVGVALLLLQNHARHIILASAESSDAALRITSIIIVLCALGLMLAPFFI